MTPTQLAPVSLPHRDLTLPSPPEAPSKPAFPVIATLAPVVASLALFAITRSPFALVFAVLGPVVAVGSLLDSGRQRRRHLRRERARFDAEVANIRAAIDLEHHRFREHLLRTTRSARVITAAGPRDPERWRYDGATLRVTVGTGARRAALRITNPPPTGMSGDEPGLSSNGSASRSRRRRTRFARERPRDDSANALTELHTHAMVTPDANIEVEAHLGIGICGSEPLVNAFARGVILQLADGLSPATHGIRGGVEGWHSALPHPVLTAPNTSDVLTSQTSDANTSDGIATVERRVDFVPLNQSTGRLSPAPTISVVTAPRESGLPRDCRVGLEVNGSFARIVRHPHLGLLDGDGYPLIPDRVRAEFVGEPEAGAAARILRAAAEREGITVQQARTVPAELELGSLWRDVDEVREAGDARTADERSIARATLRGCFLSDGEPVPLDLVADGPHAIIGGTTGSGKSELLISWVLALARAHGPDEVNFLLVDFKGGSTFAPVASLPHSVGVVTDLDAAAAGRALESLRAELRYREHLLASHGVSAIDRLARATLPRLVVVVDEFAALAAELPELGELFADVAARGRSLGVHLILCTQRPAGVIRDGVLANCTLRLSLRVASAHDSAAVIGSDAAATLPRTPLGRCFVSVAGEPPRLTQVAMASPADRAEVERQWVNATPARRPWMPPLPTRVPQSELDSVAGDSTAGDSTAAPPGEPQQAGMSIPFGLLDLPHEQRYAVAQWSPERQGNLLVVGAQSSGRSTALASFAWAARHQGLPVEHFDLDPERLWDRVHQLVAESVQQHPRILIVDDLDALIARIPDSHLGATLDAFTVLLREGAMRRCFVVASVRRLTPSLQSLVALFDARLLLRMPSRHDLVLAGGDGPHHDPTAPPGRGRWGADLVQVAVAGDDARGTVALPECSRAQIAVASVAAVITPSPGEARDHLRRAGHDATCSPGDLQVRTGEQRPVAIGDPATWQGAWGTLAAVRSTGTVVFHRCSVTEFRLISGVQSLPPLISDGTTAAWALAPDGSVARVEWPPPEGGDTDRN